MPPFPKDRPVRLLESIPQALLIADRAGRIAFSNERTETVIGYKRDELYGMSIEQLICEPWREALRAHFAACLSSTAKGALSAPLRMRRRDGAELPVEVHSSPVALDGETFLVNVLHDVSAHEAAKERLRETARVAESALRAKSASLAATSRSAPETRARDAVRATVLILDDDEAVRRATTLLLRSFGYAAAAFPDSGNAIRHLGETNSRPDVLVCDYHLGERENGLDALRAIRQALGGNIPALLVTDDTSASILALASKLDRCHLVSEPVSPQTLLGLIEGTVSQP